LPTTEHMSYSNKKGTAMKSYMLLNRNKLCKY